MISLYINSVKLKMNCFWFRTRIIYYTFLSTHTTKNTMYQPPHSRASRLVWSHEKKGKKAARKLKGFLLRTHCTTEHACVDSHHE